MLSPNAKPLAFTPSPPPIPRLPDEGDERKVMKGPPQKDLTRQTSLPPEIHFPPPSKSESHPIPGNSGPNVQGESQPKRAPRRSVSKAPDQSVSRSHSKQHHRKRGLEQDESVIQADKKVMDLIN